MRISIQNTSLHPRTAWATFTMPAGVVPVGDLGYFTSVSPGSTVTSEVVAGSEISEKIQLAHAKVQIGGGALLAGDVCWSGRGSAVVPRGSWVSSSTFEAQLTVVVSGQSYSFVLPPLDQVLSQWSIESLDPVMACGRTSFARPDGCPVVPIIWAQTFVDADYVRWFLLLTHSDPKGKACSIPLDSVNLSSSVPFSIRWANKIGAPKISVGSAGTWTAELVSPTDLGDSQSLWWQGSFLFSPTDPSPPITDSDEARRGWAELGARFETLAAEAGAGPLLAITNEWKKRRWGPEGEEMCLPFAISKSLLQQDVHASWVKFQALDSENPWIAPRLGQAKEPGRTGDQHGFGAAKALDAILLADPVPLDELEWSAMQGLACRPGHYYTLDGAAVYSRNYLKPRWITWCEVTHYHPDVSQERFGKDNIPTLGDTHGWWGRDAEHHSPLVEVAAFALTANPMMKHLLFHVEQRLFSELTLPSVHGKVATNSMGAARGIGRTFQAAHWIDWALGREPLIRLLRDRFDEILWPTWAKESLDILLNPDELPRVRVLQVHVDTRLPKGRGWRPPFEAMGAHGLYLLWQSTGDPRVLAMAYSVIRSIMNYGLLQGYSPRVLWGVHVPNADDTTEPLPLQSYTKDSDCLQFGGGDWDLWSAPGIWAGVKLARAVGDPILEDQCKQIYTDIRMEWSDRFSAQGDKLDVAKFWRWLEWMPSL